MKKFKHTIYYKIPTEVSIQNIHNVKNIHNVQIYIK